jgi:hypothetical protein
MGLTYGRGGRGTRRRADGRGGSEGARYTSFAGGGQRGGYRADGNPAGYGRPTDYVFQGRPGAPGERALSAKLGPRGGHGRLTAFLPGSGRRARSRRGGFTLRAMHVPVLAVVVVVASLAVVAAAVGVTHALTGKPSARAPGSSYHRQHGSTGGGDAARLTDSYGVLGVRRSTSRFP